MPTNPKDKVVDHIDTPCPFCNATGTRFDGGTMQAMCNVCNGTGYQVIDITKGEMDEIKKLAAAEVVGRLKKDGLTGGTIEKLTAAAVDGFIDGKLERAKRRIEADDIAFKRGP